MLMASAFAVAAPMAPATPLTVKLAVSEPVSALAPASIRPSLVTVSAPPLTAMPRAAASAVVPPLQKE